jgi:hypothetical protein
MYALQFLLNFTPQSCQTAIVKEADTFFAGPLNLKPHLDTDTAFGLYILECRV